MLNKLLKLTIIAILATSPCISFAQAPGNPVPENPAPDYSKITSKKHPKLFLSDKDFKTLAKGKVFDNIPGLDGLHKSMMVNAEKAIGSKKEITFDKAKAKTTFNGTAREFARRIISSAYAYRITKDKEYLHCAEKNINLFADKFREWTTNYWLENSELCLSFALAYDWLYKDLSNEIKDKMVKAIESVGFEDAKDEKKAWFYKTFNNWNPVCNGSLVCAAIATYEQHPEAAAEVIEKAIKSNTITLSKLYEPDGASPEGPSYWDYASNFEAILMMALEDTFGTTFGLSDYPGFQKGCQFRVFAVTNAGKWFNYGDCNSAGAEHAQSLWYYAWKYGRADLLFRDIEYLKENTIGSTRAVFMSIACALRIGEFQTAKPKELLYTSGGEVSLVIARNGWEPEDAYVGFKGGVGKINHGHMDQGSFVYEVDGVKWATEFGHPSYELYRRATKALKKEGKKYEWYDKFVYNNRRHSTLTINDSDLNPKGNATITDSWDTAERRGGRMDLSSMLDKELQSAFRSVAIVGGHDLEVIDEITAKSDKPAQVRWNLVTAADVEISDGCILLKKDGKTMTLKADRPVEYKTWSSDPKDYEDSPVRRFESKQEKNCPNICGFEFSIGKGESVRLITTIAK